MIHYDGLRRWKQCKKARKKEEQAKGERFSQSRSYHELNMYILYVIFFSDAVVTFSLFLVLSRPTLKDELFNNAKKERQ